MPAIALCDLSKCYHIYSSPRDRLLQSLFRGRRASFTEHQALKPINLTVARGETLGIVGVNGSGKSTLLQLICGTLQPTSGECVTKGRISALLELGAGFNPEFSGHENIILNATILGLSRAEIDDRYESIVSFSGLDAAMLERPVKTYSSGMYVRLAFAVAIAVDPDILIVDEALAVGDEAFQRKCFARIRALQENGATILFVSHSARTVTDLCSRAIMLDQGEMILEGAPKDVMEQYHRMIYAPIEQQGLIRDAILAKHRMGPDQPLPSVAKLPESRISYIPSGAEIINTVLYDEKQQPTHILEVGKTYGFSFDVRFDETVSGAGFSMLIKAKTGLELAGSLCHAHHFSLKEITAGSVVNVRFSFVNRMCDGAYFINCGVVSRDVNGERFLHRIVDAAQFQVMPILDNDPKRKTYPTAMIDLDASVILDVMTSSSVAV
ncbi:MAG: ABC transporter ATP-binding protein [Rickettsiales bacterium]|nr:ABC transporter ATP-binding protein [Rickettsiales bacterium]